MVLEDNIGNMDPVQPVVPWYLFSLCPRLDATRAMGKENALTWKKGTVLGKGSGMKHFNSVDI